MLHSAGHVSSEWDEEGSESLSDESSDNVQEDSLNYQQYTISHNEYTRNERREELLLGLKELCHGRLSLRLYQKKDR